MLLDLFYWILNLIHFHLRKTRNMIPHYLTSQWNYLNLICFQYDLVKSIPYFHHYLELKFKYWSIKHFWHLYSIINDTFSYVHKVVTFTWTSLGSRLCRRHTDYYRYVNSNVQWDTVAGKRRGYIFYIWTFSHLCERWQNDVSNSIEMKKSDCSCYTGILCL